MAVCCLLLKCRVSFLRIPVSRHLHRHSAAMKHKNSIPDRWTEYIPVGKRIPGTRFIAFKVPLKNMYDHKLAPWQRFSTSDLIQEVKKQNEELGMVVDLTCTQRYYSPQEFPESINYFKIFTIGHEVPSDDVISQFKVAVKQYLSDNVENDKLVGVHCTHGLNRTGYLVCRYLIDMLSMEPAEAIEKFNKSRGHSIERNNYLDDLLHGKSRSNAAIDIPQSQNLQHFPNRTAHSQPPSRAEAKPWSHSHTVHAPGWGPRFSGPPFAQPPLHHKPGQAMGPRHGFSHPGGRYPSHGPRIPQPGFPPPYMPGPRHSLPQMEGNAPNHFSHRGHNRQRHHAQRPFPHDREYDAVNGAPPRNGRPHFSQQRDNNPGHYFPSQHGDTPYQRYPRPDYKKKPKQQWQ
ncbi:RNA/RNP complex-1-interacting phosphatase [Dendropsophus ebraccatus]|uniref:RNA/RNP complex-1-interacting phosphatase n=1 Tax=Dendropsophus ebraccatus TaxID=150705 RepID=UPI0038316BE7